MVTNNVICVLDQTPNFSRLNVLPHCIYVLIFRFEDRYKVVRIFTINSANVNIASMYFHYKQNENACIVIFFFCQQVTKLDFISNGCLHFSTTCFLKFGSWGDTKSCPGVWEPLHWKLPLSDGKETLSYGALLLLCCRLSEI